MESAELLHYGSATLRAGDVGVVVSRSGGSIEPVLVAEKMRQVGMTVIGVKICPAPTSNRSPISLCRSAPGGPADCGADLYRHCARAAAAGGGGAGGGKREAERRVRRYAAGAIRAYR